ncbi:UNVERIFIED_CONTAM: hypothetical protein GTU68_029214 [Idotea baltica]|nr:hypothetical protein [Idotea baltica]
MTATTLDQSSTATNTSSQRILVLDFGSQYAQLIARRVREQSVYCEIVKHDITPEQIKSHNPVGLILSGGPNSVYEDGAPKCHPGIFDIGIPVLGICYGMQLVCENLGGKVSSTNTREYGRAMCEVSLDSEIFEGFPQQAQVWMSHGDQVQSVSDDFSPLASTDTCPVAAVKHNSLPVYGLQFHPEVTHTPEGSILLKNFLYNVCKCTGTWKLSDFAAEAIERIRKQFIECFKAEAETIQDAKYLAQGTLYPDVIESGAAKDGPAATIKLHHNVGGLPEELGFELIEPLRDLFKDEVRQLGVELGLPEDLVWRHPFPGPGLAVRCLGEVTEDKLVVLREADAIVIEEVQKANLYRSTSQLFAVLLPVQSVGVMGDARTYENALVIRCVDTDDFMTADWSRLPYDLLATMSTRIINEVAGVNRVCYDISSKPPATIEWE